MIKARFGSELNVDLDMLESSINTTNTEVLKKKKEKVLLPSNC